MMRCSMTIKSLTGHKTRELRHLTNPTKMITSSEKILLDLACPVSNQLVTTLSSLDGLAKAYTRVTANINLVPLKHPVFLLCCHYMHVQGRDHRLS